MTETYGQPCPCGSGAGYHVCCGPLHHGERHAETAEQLMRSRYSAFARGDSDYLFRTWHPRTRPSDLILDAEIVWSSLEMTDTSAGGAPDDHGEVEFTARFTSGGRPGAMHERSRFQRRAGRWVYVDGDVE